VEGVLAGGKAARQHPAPRIIEKIPAYEGSRMKRSNMMASMVKQHKGYELSCTLPTLISDVRDACFDQAGLV